MLDKDFGPIPIVSDATVRWIAEHWSARGTKREGPGFAFLSIPFDYAVSHRPGARFGPERILKVLNEQSVYCVDKDVNMASASLCSFGSVDVVHSFEESYRRMRHAVAEIPGDLIPIVLGGDHSISDPVIRGVCDRLGKIPFGLIVFDAHFDSREPIAGKEHSGHWMHTLGDVLDYRKTAQLGINATIYSDAYMHSAREQGVFVRTPYDIRRRGLQACVHEAIERVAEGTRGVYVSVDIDSIDQSQAPGTSVPNPCGLFAHEVIDGVFEVASRVPVLGLDVTEVSPPLDPDDRTSRVAAQIIINFMAGVVSRRRRHAL